MAINLGGEHELYMRDRFKVKNLVMYEHGQPGGDDLWCKICNQKRVIMSKAQLLGIGLSDNFNQRVNEKCDDETGYSFCSKCCHVIFEPLSSSLQPNEWVKKNAPVMCVKCMLGATNQRLTYSPKLMHESDEQSPKRWYWHCSNCNHREEMSPSNLIKTYQTENKSFVRSLSSTKKKPDADLPSGATLTDDRNYPPPQ